jgi:hypothetical protein
MEFLRTTAPFGVGFERRERSAISVCGLSLPNRIQGHTGKAGNSRQVSGTSDASKTQLRLIRSGAVSMSLVT